MRLCTFTYRGETTAGVIDDEDKVVDLRGDEPGPRLRPAIGAHPRRGAVLAYLSHLHERTGLG